MGSSERGLRTLSTLLPAANIDAEIRGDAAISDIEYDSRRVSSGHLFCCMPGQLTDGHDFASKAVSAGAVALLVQRFLDVDVPQALVSSVRRVLGPLAHEFFGRPSDSLVVAAVTGTNGKTTTTYLLESIARAAGTEPGVIGTVSRRFAGTSEPAPMNTPEAADLHRLLRRMLDAGVKFVALEASSDGLAQDRLRATRVASAGFTNLTQDHLNTHGSMEAYFEAKTMLFDTAYTQNAVINVGDEWGRALYKRSRSKLDVWTYGTADADITAEDVELGAQGTKATLRTPAGPIEMTTSLVGRYNLSNCICASGMALQCGFSAAETAAGIAQLRVAPGRLETVDEGQDFLALVDYAHTPDALEQAIRACRELTQASRGGSGGRSSERQRRISTESLPANKREVRETPRSKVRETPRSKVRETPRLIVVFGCGGDRDKTKRPLMGEAATRGADVTIVTSDNPRSEDPDAIIADIRPGAERGGGKFVEISDRREAIDHAIAIARSGDVVLVAGKGHEQGQKFADRTIPFDDREVVREALRGVACRS